MNIYYKEFKSEEEWNLFFYNLFYTNNYHINEIVGTLESELNFILSYLIKNELNKTFFWDSLINTFITLPSLYEYTNTIYNIICFLKMNTPNIHKQALREIVKNKRYANLKNNSEDEFNLNDLILYILILDTYKNDHFIELQLNNGLNQNYPYHHYLISIYYYNIGKSKMATNLLKSFLYKSDSLITERCFANCLYAYDDNIPSKITWTNAAIDIAKNNHLLSLDSKSWQINIFSQFINNRVKNIELNTLSQEDKISLIIIYTFFTKNKELFESHTSEIWEYDESNIIIRNITKYLYITQNNFVDEKYITTDKLVLSLYNKFKSNL